MVVVQIMPTEQHLPDRSAVHEDEGRQLARSVCRFENLPMNFHAIGGLENDLFRHYQPRGWKVARQGLRHQRSHSGSVNPRSKWEERAMRREMKKDNAADAIEYRCIQPSFADGNSRRSPATHCQNSALAKPGYESSSRSPERQTCFPSPVRASATQIAHGCKRSRSFEKVSMILNRRMKARRRPSGDQRGAMSRSTLGETKRRRLALIS